MLVARFYIIAIDDYNIKPVSENLKLKKHGSFLMYQLFHINDNICICVCIISINNNISSFQLLSISKLWIGHYFNKL